MTAPTIDLNADVGEDPAALASGAEAALIAQITSANIACGGHAGDDESMRAVVEMCRAQGVAIGAHPSFPDRDHFGRVALPMTADAIAATVAGQIERLRGIVRALGGELSHVKPHGALYHVASTRLDVADAIARAARQFSTNLVLVGQVGSVAVTRWRESGCNTLAEAFADRRYEHDGSLRQRGLPGAVLTDPEEVAAQALRLARGDGALTVDGSVVRLSADTLCLHGDTPGAVTLARAVRQALAAAGIAVQRAAPRAPTT